MDKYFRLKRMRGETSIHHNLPVFSFKHSLVDLSNNDDDIIEVSDGLDVIDLNDGANSGPSFKRPTTPPIVQVYDRLLGSKSPDCTPWGLPNPWVPASLHREDSTL